MAVVGGAGVAAHGSRRVGRNVGTDVGGGVGGVGGAVHTVGVGVGGGVVGGGVGSTQLLPHSLQPDPAAPSSQWQVGASTWAVSGLFLTLLAEPIEPPKVLG